MAYRTAPSGRRGTGSRASAAKPSASAPLSSLLCTLWQLMQLTLALACGERSKFGCAPAWQLRHVASTSLGRSLGGIEDLGHVAAAIHVRLARSVAAFAGDPALAVHLRHLGVRIVSEFLGGLFVAGRARFRANELARIGLQCLRTGWFVCLLQEQPLPWRKA